VSRYCPKRSVATKFRRFPKFRRFLYVGTS
jgi:hypothetical protein